MSRSAQRICTAIAAQVGTWSLMKFALTLYEGHTGSAGVYLFVAPICVYAVVYLLMEPSNG